MAQLGFGILEMRNLAADRYIPAACHKRRERPDPAADTHNPVGRTLARQPVIQGSSAQGRRHGVEDLRPLVARLVSLVGLVGQRHRVAMTDECCRGRISDYSSWVDCNCKSRFVGAGRLTARPDVQLETRTYKAAHWPSSWKDAL